MCKDYRSFIKQEEIWKLWRNLNSTMNYLRIIWNFMIFIPTTRVCLMISLIMDTQKKFESHRAGKSWRRVSKSRFPRAMLWEPICGSRKVRGVQGVSQCNTLSCYCVTDKGKHQSGKSPSHKWRCFVRVEIRMAPAQEPSKFSLRHEHFSILHNRNRTKQARLGLILDEEIVQGKAVKVV